MGLISKATYRKRKERERRAAGIQADPSRVERMKGQMVPVVCVETGKSWRSIAECADEIGCDRQTIWSLLNESKSHRLRCNGMHYYKA